METWEDLSKKSVENFLWLAMDWGEYYKWPGKKVTFTCIKDASGEKKKIPGKEDLIHISQNFSVKESAFKNLRPAQIVPVK